MASLQSGVPVEKIEAAARIYATGERVNGRSSYNEPRGRSGIFYAMGITQRSNGTDNVMTLANLIAGCKIPPAVNQVQLLPFVQ